MIKKPIFSPGARKAIGIGGLCSVAYLAVYIAKNILSAASPQITETGAYTVEFVGTLSALYYSCYAVGQLINGYIGDKVKTKYMISFGLILASLGFFLLPQFQGHERYAAIAYGSAGFFMAMIYGPMTKVVAENTDPIYATRCSMGYTLASFMGSPIAGMLAASIAWQWAFRASAGIMVLMGVICFLVFSLMERKGVVKYGQFKPKEKGAAGNIKLLIKRRIIKFAVIAILTGVVRTTVVFWLPTYISQHLGFSSSASAKIFTVATLCVSSSTFLAIFVYERLKRNMDLTIFLAFLCSAISFLLVFFISQPAVNIVLMVAGILTANCASNMLWSRYCPSLYDTGMVSGATGFLDCCSYAAASAASKIFANAVSTIGWSMLILVWFGLMAIGVAISIPLKRKSEIRI